MSDDAPTSINIIVAILKEKNARLELEMRDLLIKVEKDKSEILSTVRDMLDTRFKGSDDLWESKQDELVERVKKTEDSKVSQTEFAPVKSLVFGVTGMFLIAIIGALIKLVVLR